MSACARHVGRDHVRALARTGAKDNGATVDNMEQSLNTSVVQPVVERADIEPR